MTTTHAADWYPDPSGRHELRYWDGAAWTEHVSTSGRASVDRDPITSGPVPTTSQTPDQIQQQLTHQAGIPAHGITGAESLFDQPVLVVNQKTKLIELTNEYAIFDQAGRQIGAVRQVGQSKARKVVRVLTSLDQFMTHHLQVVDAAGAVVLTVRRPAKLVKSRLVISDADGRQVGEVRQENAIGKIHFALVVGTTTIGSINAENWRAWNFAIRDSGGDEVARITKTWEGLAKTLFTTADNYVLKIHRPLTDPLRTLVVASALCVDTALKQDARGFG